VIFISALVLGETPFNVLELLWINMIMDTFAAFALATEPPKRILGPDTIKSGELIISPAMWRNILT